MINLKRPFTNAEADFRAIIASKEGEHGEVLQRLSSSVLRSFASYEWRATENSLELLVPMYPRGKGADAERKALLHCYESHTKALGDLRSRIFAAQGDVGAASCQYCCGLNTGGELTLDHYLPKAEFPEFAVLGENLVPCCAACNTRREAWLNQSGRRTTLNFYRDRLPAKALLVARLEREAGVGWRAIFDYDQTDTSAIALLFRRHCEALHLLDRITLASRAELSSLQRQVRGWIRAGREASFVVSLLEEQSKADEHEYGFNYWRAVLRRAVSKASGFLNECYKSVEAM